VCAVLGWRHGGFSVHNEVSVAPKDAEGRGAPCVLFDGFLVDLAAGVLNARLDGYTYCC